MHRHARWWGVLLALVTVPSAAAVGPDSARAGMLAPAAPIATPEDTDDAASRERQRKRERQRERRRLAKRVVHAARTRIGSPYAYGATGPRAFDCSGLTQWSMRRVGIDLPRSSFAQARAGDRIARRNVRAGDLVFFSTAGPGASHVGIATGPRTAISATGSGGVRVHEISDGYWGAYYVGARRVD